MSVDLLVGSIAFEIGSSGFFSAFFHTVAAKLESGRWGSRFPTIMNELYRGAVSPDDVPKALNELRIIRHEMSELKPTDLILGDASLATPWREADFEASKSLSDLFITSGGNALLDVVERAFSLAAKKRRMVEVM